MAVHASLPNVVVASQFGSFANKVFLSDDYGHTWSEVGNAEIYAENVHIVRIVSSQKNPGYFYILGSNFTTGTIGLTKTLDNSHHLSVRTKF